MCVCVRVCECVYVFQSMCLIEQSLSGNRETYRLDPM